MSLEEGVRKLTFMVASIFGLHDRGLLRPGMAADLALFDPATIRECEPEMVSDLPGGEKRLIQKATGIEMTIVNGEVLVEKGAHTGALPEIGRASCRERGEISEGAESVRVKRR